MLASLDASAARLDEHADELRRRAAMLAAASESVRWCSPAASAFQARSTTLCSQLHRCAGNLDHAAQVLREHAATARHVADAVTNAVTDVVMAPVNAVEAIVGWL